MPEIPCRLVTIRPGVEIPLWETEDGAPLSPGDIFYAPQMVQDFYRDWLSAAYWALSEPRRPPLIVILPGGHWHCVDQQQCSDGKFHEPGWAVTGEPPLLTVHPSINIGGCWHGWLQNGVLRR